MNISSYNIADVGYHYIGLRVLGRLSPTTVCREEQLEAISRSVRKYVNDRALRLLLPEPRGTFESIGEKVCRELVHFGFAASHKGTYELTERGNQVLGLLDGRKNAELRQAMARVHLKTYDNLRAMVQKHLEIGSIWRPIVETTKLSQEGYLKNLLEPTFAEDAHDIAASVEEIIQGKGAKAIENELHKRVLAKMLQGAPQIRASLFRSIADRLVSLRLLNIRHDSVKGCEFRKSYSPCAADSPPHDWYIPLSITPSSGLPFTVYFCEPDMTDKTAQEKLLGAIDKAFLELSSQGGYYDLPDVRDLTCERLQIPEAAFDEGINQLLDSQPAPLTMGLTYDRISGRRKPLVRSRASSQLYNLIRRA